MDPLIVSYLQAEERLRIAREKAASSLTLAKEAARPVGALRVATARDIVVGNLLWYKNEGWDPSWEEPEYYWKIVGEVYNPSDEWKAYTSHDGCRYGLDGAMVEAHDHITED